MCVLDESEPERSSPRDSVYAMYSQVDRVFAAGLILPILAPLIIRVTLVRLHSLTRGNLLLSVGILVLRVQLLLYVTGLSPRILLLVV